MNELKEFLIKAKQQTYANENIEKKEPSRKGSFDYEYSENGLTYHDTYFGGTKFMGCEVVYSEDETPVWGMNYYGVTLDESLSEEAIDKALRPALMMVGNDDILPLRGPKEFTNGDYTYTFEVTGTLDYFEGLETICKGENKVYQLKCHGGIIKR